MAGALPLPGGARTPIAAVPISPRPMTPGRG
nr:MAG TPA: hypothetical protein [Caudoviricetes sp.]